MPPNVARASIRTAARPSRRGATPARRPGWLGSPRGAAPSQASRTCRDRRSRADRRRRTSRGSATGPPTRAPPPTSGPTAVDRGVPRRGCRRASAGHGRRSTSATTSSACSCSTACDPRRPVRRRPTRSARCSGDPATDKEFRELPEGRHQATAEFWAATKTEEEAAAANEVFAYTWRFTVG